MHDEKRDLCPQSDGKEQKMGHLNLILIPVLSSPWVDCVHECCINPLMTVWKIRSFFTPVGGYVLMRQWMFYTLHYSKNLEGTIPRLQLSWQGTGLETH